MKKEDIFNLLKDFTLSHALKSGFAYEQGKDYIIENLPFNDPTFHDLVIRGSFDKDTIRNIQNKLKKPFYCKYIANEALELTNSILTDLNLTWVADVVTQCLEDIPPFISKPRTNVKIVKVSSLAQLEAFDHITSIVFEHSLGRAVQYFKICIEQPEDSDHLFLTYVNDKPVGTGRLTYHSTMPVAYLSWGGVLPEYRNQGLATVMVLSRIEEAKKQGFKSIFTNNMPSSLNLYQRIGFKPIRSSQLFFSSYDNE